jgi:hypothetical protein
MAAPKGNKFALGLKNSGKPLIFKDEKQLLNKIKHYFQEHLPFEKTDEESGEKYIVNPTPLTITGLALYLGFESRQSFYDYEKKEEYSYIIKRARLAIESCYEEGLHYKTPTGSIFALKNMGWFDRQELTGKEGTSLMPPVIVFKDFTDD